MTVDFAYSIIKFATNKAQSGSVSPAEIGKVLTAAAHQFTDHLLGQDQGYAPGRPVPRVGLGANQRLRQSLSPLIEAPSALAIAGGRATMPADLVAVDAMYQSDGYSKIRFVEQDRLQGYVESVIDPIADHPVYLIENGSFLFYPASLTAAKLSYVKKHPDIVWAHEADANGRPTYTATGSAHPLFSDVDMLEVLARALRLVGVNLQAAHVAQYAEAVKVQG